MLLKREKFYFLVTAGDLNVWLVLGMMQNGQ